MVASRLADHVSGRIGSSTFRLSMAALLMGHLDLQLVSDARRPCLTDEAPLTR